MNWKNIFDKFKNNKILIIGDIMMDTYFIGKVDRISPEAPVPVVDIEEKMNKLGGAANVALNIRELGATPIICSIMGRDQKGKELEKLLNDNRIDPQYIFKSINRITTNKIRVIGNNVQMLRVDDETKEELDDETYERLKDNIIVSVAANSVDAIIFQDYDKGVISKKMIDYIVALSKRRNIPLFIDPKLKNFDYYKESMIFKPNFNELKRGLKNDSLDINKLDEVKPLIEKMMIDKDIFSFYTTLGDKGILLSYKEKGEILHQIIEGERRNIADVSGAGDTVISLATLLTINHIDPINTAKISNIAGGLVCEKVGVVPINKYELLEELN